jgi:hypothetical protein
MQRALVVVSLSPTRIHPHCRQHREGECSPRKKRKPEEIVAKLWQVDVAVAQGRDQLWAEAVSRHKQGAVWWIEDPALLAQARDAGIDRWLTHERSRVNHGSAGHGDWREVETERAPPLADVFVGEILEHAIGIEPARWSRADQMQ